MHAKRMSFENKSMVVIDRINYLEFIRVFIGRQNPSNDKYGTTKAYKYRNNLLYIYITYSNV